MQVSSIKSRGFTLVELIVVITVSLITMGLVIFSLGSYYQENVSSVQKTAQDADTRSVLRAIETELSNSSGFMTDLAVGSTVPLGSDNAAAAWSYKGNDVSRPNNRVLMGAAYATDKIASDDSRMVVFTDTSTGCDPSVATPAKNALIYFVARDSSTNQYNLYRRTIVNTTGGTLCGTTFQKQSCAAAYASAYPLVCKGTDALLLSNIDNFTVDYFASANDSVPIANQYTTALASAIQSAKSVVITVSTNRLIDGTTKQNTASIRINRPY